MKLSGNRTLKPTGLASLSAITHLTDLEPYNARIFYDLQGTPAPPKMFYLLLEKQEVGPDRGL